MIPETILCIGFACLAWLLTKPVNNRKYFNRESDWIELLKTRHK